jgi:hypothetical protein
VATAVTFKYSFSATNWRYMQKSCECTWSLSHKIYHQLMATQVKFPKESLATEAAHNLRHALHRSQGPTHLGPTSSIFGFLLGPNLLIHARILTSWY